MGRWKHEVGDCVDHLAGAMTAIVLGRTKTMAGNENYDVRLINLMDERRDRVISGKVTRPVIFMEERCTGCRFMRGEECLKNLQ